LDMPLPRPADASYVEARLLEALVEARLALRFLQEGIVRNAAGKAFQAWKAYMAALLRLELDKLKALAKTEEEKRWLETTAAPRVPTTRMKALSNMLEDVGHAGLVFATSTALDLHDYHAPAYCCVFLRLEARGLWAAGARVWAAYMAMSRYTSAAFSR